MSNFKLDVSSYQSHPLPRGGGPAAIRWFLLQ